MNNRPPPFFFPNFSQSQENNNPFSNMMQNNPFLNNLQNNPFLNNLQNTFQPQQQSQTTSPPTNNGFENLFSNFVDRNMVDSVFANMISSNIFPINLHEPERTLDLLLILSEKAFLPELQGSNKIEFQDFINMFRTSENKYPERKLAMFLNLLNYYTTKANIEIDNIEQTIQSDNFEPNIEPVD